MRRAFVSAIAIVVALCCLWQFSARKPAVVVAPEHDARHEESAGTLRFTSAGEIAKSSIVNDSRRDSKSPDIPHDIDPAQHSPNHAARGPSPSTKSKRDKFLLTGDPQDGADWISSVNNDIASDELAAQELDAAWLTFFWRCVEKQPMNVENKITSLLMAREHSSAVKVELMLCRSFARACQGKFDEAEADLLSTTQISPTTVRNTAIREIVRRRVLGKRK